MESVFSYESVTYLSRKDGGNGELIPEDFPGKLRIASCKEGIMDDIRISNEIAFISFDDKKIRSWNGLEYFIKTTFGGIPTVIFDNHNHSLFFWYQARESGYLKDGATLVHIDMHSDLWENENILSAENSHHLESVWKFANYSCNVGNYIKPTIVEGLVGEMVRIEGEQDLLRESTRLIPRNSILNLDLDFFAEELDDIDFELKKRVIHHFASQVSYITIATSPFFIPGERAIAALRKIFS